MHRPTTERKVDYEQILKDSLAPFQRELSTGRVSMRHWVAIVTAMHGRLLEENATPRQYDAFRIGMSRAIDGARGPHLSEAERAALLDVLWAIFYGHAMPTLCRLTPRTVFLERVEFDVPVRVRAGVTPRD